MKLGFAALIEGSQLTGTPAALASGESSVFAALLGEELATVPNAVKGIPRHAGDVTIQARQADAEASTAVTGEMLAAAGQVPTAPQAETGTIGLNVFDASMTGSTNTLSDASNTQPVQMFGGESARPVDVSADTIAQTEGQSASLSNTGNTNPDCVKAAAPTASSASTTSQESSGPSETTVHSPAAKTVVSDAFGQRPENALSVGGDAKHPVANLAGIISSTTPVADSSNLTQTTPEAVNAQIVAAGPLMASVQTSAMAAQQAPKALKGDAITTAPLSEGSETISVAAISASGEAKPTGSGVAQQTQSGLLSSDRPAASQTPQAQPQMTTPQSQAATLPPGGQAGQDGFELLPDADAEGMLAEAVPDAETDATAPQSLRADAKAVEAAAQNAVRNSATPQMAGLVSRVGEQFLQRFNGKTSSFEIRLDPPELGKVDIRVEVGADGKVMAVIAARDPSVVDALLRGAKTLENALTEAGLSLDEGGIQVELDQKNSSSFADAYSNEFADEYPGANGPAGENLAEAGPESPSNTVIQSWSRHRLDLTA